jgi:NAD(P)H dehydrogenase (quinone)
VSDTLLVTGASGQLGRRVLAHLLDTCAVPPARLIAVTRDPAKLADFAARGVEVRRGDFDDPGSLGEAFKGAGRLLLISTDALDTPGRRLAQHQAAIAAAKTAGVRHIVYTSMPNPDGSPIPFAPDHLGTEQALALSGRGWTILRNAWYFENLAFSLPGALASGKWFTASGDGRIAHLSRNDCARAAAFALAAEPGGTTVYDITGPVAETTAEIAALVSQALGKPIEVVQVSDDDLVRGMVAAGVPEPMAAILASFDTNTRLGRAANVSDAIEKLTGRKPETLRSYLAANSQTFLPDHGAHT